MLSELVKNGLLSPLQYHAGLSEVLKVRKKIFSTTQEPDQGCLENHVTVRSWQYQVDTIIFVISDGRRPTG